MGPAPARPGTAFCIDGPARATLETMRSALG